MRRILSTVIVIIMVVSLTACGVVQMAETESKSEITCSACGEKIESKAAFCEFCGERQDYTSEDDGSVYTVYTEVFPNVDEFTEVEADLTESVTEMVKAGNQGYAFSLTAESIYSSSPMEMVLGIDINGKITNLIITRYFESMGRPEDFEALFSGKNADTQDIIAGCTLTSNAIKTAISDAYNLFCEHTDFSPISNES